jgi:hypothetical protein
MTATGRPGRWSPPANCTLIAREAISTVKQQGPGSGTVVLTWAFTWGAGDGNRTRTISLGICAVRACHMA